MISSLKERISKIENHTDTYRGRITDAVSQVRGTGILDNLGASTIEKE